MMPTFLFPADNSLNLPHSAEQKNSTKGIPVLFICL